MLAFIVGCIVLAAWGYQPALHGSFLWDDAGHVADYADLFNLKGLAQIWLHPGLTQQYYPMTYTGFAAQYHLWGLHTTGYHLTNIALHLINALLIGWLLRKLRVRYAGFCAALFALHPVCVESVAWISEFKNVFSTFFYLLALFAYLSFEMPLKTPRRFTLYGLSLLLFFAAILTKTIACTFPAAILLILWWKRGALRRADVIRLFPFLALGLLVGHQTSWLERYSIGTMGPEWNLSWIQRILISGRDLWFYAGKLVLPYRLSFMYEHWAINPLQAWQYAFPLSWLALLLFAWRKRDVWGRGVFTALALFTASLAPALGFFNFYPMRFSFVADHFQYLACIPLLALLGSAFGQGLERARVATLPRYGLLITLCVLAAAVTRQRAYAFADNESLWRDTLVKNPNSDYARLNLGTELMPQGRLAEAEAQLQIVLLHEPLSLLTRLNLAALYIDENRPADALNQYALATQPQTAILDNVRGFPTVYFCYYLALQKAGRPAEAHAKLELAAVSLQAIDEALLPYGVRKSMRYLKGKVYDELALWEVLHGNLNKAAAYLRTAIDAQPLTAPLHEHLAAVSELQRRAAAKH